MQNDLIRIVHTEESESKSIIVLFILMIGQLKPRLEKTFWEKLGFKDKKKEDQNMKDAKEKTDKMFRQLKETIKGSRELQGQLEDCRNLIKFQEHKTVELKESLE